MRVQSRSQGFQNKEGKRHQAAKDRVIRITREKEFTTYPEASIFVFAQLRDENGKQLDAVEFRHPFDMLAYKKSKTTKLTICKAIEVDGEIHTKAKVKARDLKTERLMSELFPDYDLKRIDKYHILGQHPDGEYVASDEQIAQVLGLK